MSAKIFVSGDIVNSKNKDAFIDENLQDLIKDSDFAVCNFEAPIEGVEEKYAKVGSNLSQKKESVELLKKSGFGLFLLANNHMYDYGHKGLMKTLELANKNKVETIGAGKNYADAYKPLIKNLKGLEIAFINASEAQFGVLDGTSLNENSGYAWINHSIIDETIIDLKGKVDKIIVFAHAGLEHYKIPMVQWQSRYKNLCDLGADCIIGSHPHIPQGIEVYKNKTIFYSLGNFYFDTINYVNKPDHSFSVILDVSKTEINYKLVFHYKKDGKVRILSEDEVPFKMDELNRIIHDKTEIEKMYVDAYKRTTRKMFANIYASYLSSDSLMRLVKKTVLKFTHTSKAKVKRELFLQHLNRNETHRWVTITAIEILNRKNKE